MRPEFVDGVGGRGVLAVVAGIFDQCGPIIGEFLGDDHIVFLAVVATAVIGVVFVIDKPHRYLVRQRHLEIAVKVLQPVCRRGQEHIVPAVESVERGERRLETSASAAGTAVATAARRL